jgi:hypothetical protein
MGFCCIRHERMRRVITWIEIMSREVQKKYSSTTSTYASLMEK